MSDSTTSISDASASAATGGLDAAQRTFREAADFPVPAITYGAIVNPCQVAYDTRLTERLDEITGVSTAVQAIINGVLANARTADRSGPR